MPIKARKSNRHSCPLTNSFVTSFEPDDTIDYTLLAGEAKSSVQHCIAHGRNTCISRAYYYPLMDCYPALDLEQAATHLGVKVKAFH